MTDGGFLLPPPTGMPVGAPDLSAPTGVPLVAVPAPPRPATASGILALVGAGALAVGSFLPWATITAPFVGTVSRSGMEGGDGWMSVIVAVVAGLVGLRLLSSPPAGAQRVLLALGGVAGLGLALFEFNDISRRFADAKAAMDSEGSFFGTDPSEMIATSFGPGLYLLALGAVLLFVACAKANEA